MAEVFISLKQLPGPGLRAKARKRCVAEGSRSLSPSPCRRRDKSFSGKRRAVAAAVAAGLEALERCQARVKDLS